MSLERTRERGNEIGPTGQTFGKNLRRIRRALGLSTAAVAERLEGIDRPIPASSVGRIESGYRKAEVDDLMALAVVLDVSPLALLLPDTRRPSEVAEISGTSPIPAAHIWKWAVGDEPLTEDGDTDLSVPAWMLK